MPLINMWVNPLKWLDADPRSPAQGKPTPSSLVSYLTSPDVEGGFDALVARYHQVSEMQDPLFAALAERNILEKLVWPLRSAKGNYALGNYLGCIGLSGMVGEMVALLLWDISQPQLAKRHLDDAAQRALFGRSFERLGQQRRVEVMEGLGLVERDSVVAFDGLRNIRRRYLHLYSQDHAHIADDALKAYGHAITVVAGVLGQSMNEGRLLLRSDLMDYLKERGLLDAGDDDEPQDASHA